MMVILGIVATLLFVSGTASQTIKSMKDGYSDVSNGLIWNLLVGFACMMVYVPNTLGWDWVLMTGYILQSIGIVVIGYYKYFPRKNES